MQTQMGWILTPPREGILVPEAHDHTTPSCISHLDGVNLLLISYISFLSLSGFQKQHL